MFEEVKNSVEDAIDITDMFEFGGPSLVMARRFPTKKGEETPGGGTWVNFCWVCAAGLSRPLPQYSLFCSQL